MSQQRQELHLTVHRRPQGPHLVRPTLRCTLKTFNQVICPQPQAELFNRLQPTPMQIAINSQWHIHQVNQSSVWLMFHNSILPCLNTTDNQIHIQAARVKCCQNWWV